MNNIFPNRFKNKVVVITGAAQGIGKGVAERIAREGGSVVLIDRSKIVIKVVDDLIKSKLMAVSFIANLEAYSGFENALKKTKEIFGKIDVLINNVGGTIWAKPYVHYRIDEIQKEIGRSLFPTLWGCHSVLPYMIEQQSGSIVNISSIATRSINRVPYAAAKGGVNAITASLALECAEHNIRVNGIATGGTEAPPRIILRNTGEQTEQEKIWYEQIIKQTIDSSLMKRYGTIDEQVNAILFLASDEASYITGITLPVSGGDLG